MFGLEKSWAPVSATWKVSCGPGLDLGVLRTWCVNEICSVSVLWPSCVSQHCTYPVWVTFQVLSPLTLFLGCTERQGPCFMPYCLLSLLVSFMLALSSTLSMCTSYCILWNANSSCIHIIIFILDSCPELINRYHDRPRMSSLSQMCVEVRGDIQPSIWENANPYPYCTVLNVLVALTHLILKIITITTEMDNLIGLP